MRVTAIGAAASIGGLEADGTVIVTVKPWWSSTRVERGGRSVFRESLPEILVPVEGDPSARERRKAYVDAVVRDHDTWTKVVSPEEFERLWRGILEIHVSLPAGASSRGTVAARRAGLRVGQSERPA